MIRWFKRKEKKDRGKKGEFAGNQDRGKRRAGRGDLPRRDRVPEEVAGAGPRETRTRNDPLVAWRKGDLDEEDEAWMKKMRPRMRASRKGVFSGAFAGGSKERGRNSSTG